jgi:hypothetical protein
MTHVSITCMTKGAHDENKRNDAVDHPIFLFFSFFFSLFSLLSLRCNPPSLSTIKGEIGHPMQSIARQAGYNPVQANKHAQLTET